MAIIYFNEQFSTVSDAYSEGSTVYLVIGDGLPYETAKKFANEMHETARPAEYGCYIDNASLTPAIIGRQFDHIQWEPMKEGIDYAETCHVFVLEFLKPAYLPL